MKSQFAKDNRHRSASTDAVKPNLFIIGAMKAATSSLHAYLSKHPDIYMSATKEPGYFIDPIQETSNKIRAKGYRYDLAEYLALFRAGAGRAYRGESTTDYTKMPLKTGCAHRIQQFNADAKIVYVVRYPIDRTISHYWWNVNTGDEVENPLTAIKSNRFYRDVSYYAMQLRPYLERFPAGAIKVITTRALTINPQSTLNEIFEWLGLSQFDLQDSEAQWHNVTPQSVTQVRNNLLHRVRNSSFWNAIGPVIPPAIRRWGARLAERSINRSDVDLRPVRRYLLPSQREQVAELSEVLDCKFDAWEEMFEAEE